MTIKQDYSYIGKFDTMLVDRGFAEPSIYSLNFQFEYTEEQQMENRTYHDTHTEDEWMERIKEKAQYRSEYMHRVLEKISTGLELYQYKHGDLDDYRKGKWDLFFWCNCFENTMHATGLTGRDYSYFRLSFNEYLSGDRRTEILNEILALMEKMEETENVHLTVQRDVRKDKEKISVEAQRLIDMLAGKRGTYDGDEGRFLVVGGKLVFMKKYARKYGYSIPEASVLKVAWENDIY